MLALGMTGDVSCAIRDALLSLPLRCTLEVPGAVAWRDRWAPGADAADVRDALLAALGPALRYVEVLPDGRLQPSHCWKPGHDLMEPELRHLARWRGWRWTRAAVAACRLRDDPHGSLTL